MDAADGVYFLESIFEILKDAGVIGEKKENEKVVKFEHPQVLDSILNLSLKDATDGKKDEELRKLCLDIINYSVKTSHRRFHNQLYGGVDIYSLAGSWITDALNTSQYTFEVAPVFSLIEQKVLSKAFEVFGFPNDADGIFCPGGSMSNMYAMVLARFEAFPMIKTEGMSCLPKLAIFTSQDSHYSIKKGSHWLGIGTSNIVYIKTDANGRMIPDVLKQELEKAKDGGMRPFFVNATAGTTVLGALDPLNEIADICKEYHVWMHVDACLGGTLKLSKKYSYLLNGIHRADSIAWNPHKTLGAPLQCSIFMVKKKGLLHECNSATALYLFQQDKFYDVSYDTGDKSVQCGRKVDAFKLWMAWKARGDMGFEKLVDNAMQNASYFRDKISERLGFELVIKDIQFTNICFWYVPLSMRDTERNEEWWNQMHKVAPKIKERMILKGSLMIGYTPLDHKGVKNFFRMVVTCHPPATKEDMDFVIEEIEKCGEEILF